ncbi:MAG: CBS domain-containing protein [Alphaproteobacteria bacterium]
MTTGIGELLQIPDNADIRAAMLSLRASGMGLVVIHDAVGRAVGVMTDGDVRIAMLAREDMNAPVTEFMNRQFVFVREGTPKERILKLLDSRIRVIPILDGEGRLVDVVRSGYLEPRKESFARGRAPVRLSLAGGGTDFTAHFMEHGGVSLCTTITKHSHATLRRRDDGRIRIYSHDRRQSVECASLEAMTYDGVLDLLKAGVRVMRPDFGFDLSVKSDFLPGSGLGGSAAVLAAVIGCFNEYREDKLDSYAIAEHAFEAERVELGISGGWQDQYSTVFGGFNFIEFDETHNTVMPLRLQPNTLQELEERFLICYSGRQHLGETIQSDNRERDPNDPAALRFADEVKDVAQHMKSNLLRGNLADFGRMLDETWRLKKSYSQRVTSPELDDIYQAALNAGAEGGRLLGTGGGGYFLFFVKPFQRFAVEAELERRGLTIEGVLFDRKGLASWMGRA